VALFGIDDSPRWLWAAAGVVLGLTLWRVWGLWAGTTDLFVDEAQYWLWSQDPAWGYFSKPPMIAWAIGASTWAGGSDAPFWIRLPAPLFHAVTAFLLMALARGPFGNAAAAWTGITYVTLPGVAVGSAVIATDTVMFPFFAGALLGWAIMLTGRSAWWGLFAGVALGLAFLSKYAALYFWLCAVLAMLALDPPGWPGWRGFLLTLAGFLAVASPNILWNWTNGGATLLHTLSNAQWSGGSGNRATLHPVEALEFLAAQFAVFGPIVFAAFLWAAWRGLRGRAQRPENLMLLFSVPVVLLILGQALYSRAYANWAAVAVLAGTVAVVGLMLQREWTRTVLTLSFLLHAAIAIGLPLALVFAETLTVADRQLFKRLTGRADLSTELIEAAGRGGVTTIVAPNRDILADLFHTGRDSGLAFRARQGSEPPSHHYAAAYPYAGGAMPVLWVIEGNQRPSCPARAVVHAAPETGAHAGRVFTGWVVPGNCPGLVPED
jgi:4-amino-4-deoxy-L-arabinose transferase-like glycosyltransferase